MIEEIDSVARPTRRGREAGAEWERLALLARLASIAESHYRSSLALTALLEVLTAKGMITREEIARQAAQLESAADRQDQVVR